MTEPKFDYKVLPPEALPLMLKYRETAKRLSVEIDRIQEKAQKEAEAAHTQSMEEMKLLWYKMAPMAGLDAEQTWRDPAWGVESRYAKDGFAALVYIERPSSPLANMFGGPPPTKNADEDGPPSGASIN